MHSPTPKIIMLIALGLLQGRGGSTGYDNAVALPARADSEELAKENSKSVVALKGEAVFSIAKVRRLLHRTWLLSTAGCAPWLCHC